jgi:hypothetical protein
MADDSNGIFSAIFLVSWDLSVTWDGRVLEKAGSSSTSSKVSASVAILSIRDPAKAAF